MSSSSVADSVKQRLLNKARSDNRSFNELLQYYAMERFLYRLSVSPHASNYMLKGALLLKVWSSLESRSTMDIDMLGKTKSVDRVLRHVRDILQVKVDPDGLVFDSESLRAERITKHAGYNGVRVLFWGFLGKAQIRMQIDIGFGDVVYPEPKQEALPCMLDFPAPWLLCYSPESAIAEKFQAMIYLGSLNSRMKDFYDIWLLSRQFQFELNTLKEAIHRTFAKRGTQLPHTIEAFSPDFAIAKQTMWVAFRKRLHLVHTPESFAELIREIALFLAPIIEGSSHAILWNPERGEWEAG